MFSYAVRTVYDKRHKTVKCPSVCLSRRSTKAAAAGGFAAEVLLELNFIILNIVGNKNVNCRREAAPRSLAFK